MEEEKDLLPSRLTKGGEVDSWMVGALGVGSGDWGEGFRSFKTFSKREIDVDELEGKMCVALMKKSMINLF